MDAKIVCFFIIITVFADLLKRKIMEELVFLVILSLSG